jgi:hypothetical protein
MLVACATLVSFLILAAPALGEPTGSGRTSADVRVTEGIV